MNEKLQQILRMLENAPEPGPSSNHRTERGSSSGEESIVEMTMKHASDKKADRESERKIWMRSSSSLFHTIPMRTLLPFVLASPG